MKFLFYTVFLNHVRKMNNCHRFGATEPEFSKCMRTFKHVLMESEIY